MNWTFEKVRRFYLYVGVAIGFGLHTCLKIFVKDMMGLEGYQAYLSDHWIHMSPAWGLCATIGWLGLLWRARR